MWRQRRTWLAGWPPAAELPAVEVAEIVAPTAAPGTTGRPGGDGVPDAGAERHVTPSA
ncbi:hypothetical protein [Plantactinospora sp. CA-290183]|uniref:hypothetical protein n=1 Tax=Plantactinospora sp. CA-290183 TaxID=3240006 RepID=UPI003D8EB8B3